MKPEFGIIARCLAGVLATLGAGMVRAANPPPPSLKTARVQRGDVTRFVSLPGVVRASQQATLYAKVPGYLKSIAVDKGDSVQAGQALGEIEVPELVADLAKVKAELARAQAESQVAGIEFERLTRARKQSPDLVLPQAIDAADARLAMARAGVETAKANLERNEILLAYSRITAPFAGVVTMRFVDPGAFIPAATSGSAAASAAVVTLMDFDNVRIQVSVPEVEAALAARGQPVKVSVEGLPGRSFEGTITRMTYALDEATKSMLVEAEMPNPRRELRPGMYAAVKIGIEKHTNTLLAPVDALSVEKAGSFVFKLADGKARKTAVKAGFNDGARFELLDGVAEGDPLLLIGKTALTDGQAVNSTEAK